MFLPSQRVSGVALRAIARAVQRRVASRAVYEVLRSELRWPLLAELPDSFRGPAVGKAPAIQARPPRSVEDARLPLPAAPWSGTTETLLRSYRDRSLSPVEVVSRALAAARDLAARSPSYGPMHEYADTDALKEAEASAERWRVGAPRGALDGVPFVVKEEIQVKGMAAQGGTAFLDGSPSPADATCVERLRAAGAIVLGTTVMTEYGLSPVGFNPHRRMPRNPHHAARACGGSSSGTAAAIALGLCPFGLGGDGGGSVRIPAALTGVFGIKPTWGRISRAGGIFTGSVEHIGMLATSTLDLARSLEIAGTPDQRDPDTGGAPPLERGALVRALGRGVKGLRIGVAESEWAEASSDVARACHAAARALEKDGAVLVPIESALLPFALPIGEIVLGVDAASSVVRAWRERPSAMGADLQVSLAALSHVSAVAYVQAQKLRSGLRAEAARLLGDVDLIAYPTTASTALTLSGIEWETGFVETRALEQMCRFTFLANLTGLPASSAPVGRDRHGMPIGFQLVGDAWDEATVVAVTCHLERTGVARVERPNVAADLR